MIWKLSRYAAAICFILLLAIQNSPAQIVSLSDTIYNFGEVSAYQTHQADFVLYNGQTQPLQIIAVQNELEEFSTDLSTGSLPANSQAGFHIYFSSDQNLDYEDYLRIETDAGDRPLLLHLRAQAIYEGNYYSATHNLWNAELKTALHNIIDGHTSLSYSSLWNALAVTDEDPDNSNNVILFYTGWSDAKTNHGGAVDEWNREHVWAKSHGDFGTTPPAGTDLHHIRPTDVSVNSRRGNLDFDDGGSLYVDPDGATGCRVDDDSWEPRDEVKGDVARMMYYMTVRYEGDEGYDLELVESVPSTATGESIFGKRSTLYQWHLADTVDPRERTRNDIIYSNYQGNRNPFIDHPEFAARIADIHGGSPHVKQPEIGVSPANVDLGIIGLNSVAEYFVAVVNCGEAALQLSNVSVDNPAFQVSVASSQILAGQHIMIRVSYQSGDQEVDDSAQLTLQCNDADESVIQIPLHVSVSGAVSIIGTINMPKGYRLDQNYPNPFNPGTQIRLYMPAGGATRLTVYDIDGKKIATLIDRYLPAGETIVAFSGAGLPSGIYYYSLKTSGYLLTRRMLLIK